MIYLQTVDINKQNRSLILPFLGETIIPASGVIEVSDREMAALIVDSNIGFDMFDGSFEGGAEEDTVANIIKENVLLKEENLKLSIENKSLKEEKVILQLNQKPIQVVEVIAETPAEAVASVVTEVAPEKKAVEPEKKAVEPKKVDFAAKIAASTLNK